MNDNPTPEMAVGDREIKTQAEKVNQLLHELEPMLDDNQHTVVTELLAERAVLAAMRARVELEEASRSKTGPAPAEAEDAQPKGAI